MNCPCGTGKAYDACCGRFHAGRPAPTAAQLMRSRYSAFVLRLDDYLRDTWHPGSCPGGPLTDEDTQWLELVVEDAFAGKAWDQEGVVQFVARYRDGDGEGAIRERSRFVLEDGRWLYVDGVQLPA